MGDEVHQGEEPQARAPQAGKDAGAGTAASVRVAVAIACALFSFLATNGSIYPGLVARGGAGRALLQRWPKPWA